MSAWIVAIKAVFVDLVKLVEASDPLFDPLDAATYRWELKLVKVSVNTSFRRHAEQGTRGGDGKAHIRAAKKNILVSCFLTPTSRSPESEYVI